MTSRVYAGVNTLSDTVPWSAGEDRAEHQDSGADFDAYVRASGPRLKRLAYLLTGDLHNGRACCSPRFAKTLPHWSKVPQVRRAGRVRTAR